VAQKFAGIAFLQIDGNQMALRGNFTVSPSPVERTMIAGQDGVHGYQELPRVPYIEGDISTVPDMRLEDIDGQTDLQGRPRSQRPRRSGARALGRPVVRGTEAQRAGRASPPSGLT